MAHPAGRGLRRLGRRGAAQQARRLVPLVFARLFRLDEPGRRQQHLPAGSRRHRTGDFLLERWQKNGIGHTLIVKAVTPVDGGKLGVDLGSGSMPRRQPLWEDSASSRYYFLSEITGGVGNSYDGSPYAKLGGGLRRYRVAQNIGGYWLNDVPTWTGNDGIRHDDYAAISARPAQFAQLLADVSPAQKLYPELSYGASPTCCWDSTTPQMASLVDRYNRARESASSACLQPVPFTKAHYAEFKAYAQRVGEAASWLDWHEDEPCSARAAADDTALPQAAVDYCSIKSALDASGR